ncbi:MAG: hypothetical protein F4185_08790, partial [Chloroflexi bacterium]|nr:hypothetical protein [Chloroflexota bacterium]
MAEIVLGIGASHGPTIQSQPEDWLRLGQKDMEDPRYDFDAVLASASPEIERELQPEVLQERYESIQRAIESMSNVLQETAPEAIVCVSNPHGATPQDRMEPVFGIYMSHSESKVERSGHQTSGRRKAAEPLQTFRQVEPYAISPELAARMMQCLIADGIDVASCFQSDPTAGIEGPFTFAYDMFLPDRSTPVVPFLLSRYLPHQAPSARWYAVGQSI